MPAALPRALRASLACLAAVLLAAAAVAPTVRAAYAPAGSGEPPYTKTATTNYHWWTWSAVQGFNNNDTPNYSYHLCMKTYRDNVLVEDSNGFNGPASTNCFAVRSPGSPTPASGTAYTYPFTTATVLDDGHAYRVCISGYSWYWTMYQMDSSLSVCSTSTIDRSKPQLGVRVDGDAAYTNDPNLQLRIDYADATSPPWNGSDGRASNWTCLNRGGPCTVASAPSPACSSPLWGASSRTNRFECQGNVTAQPDGHWYFCARAADWALPDNPSGYDQWGATSNQANLSDTTCGQVVLDRVAPAVSISASATSVQVGDLVTLSAGATDNASGVSGAFDWDYGDNTAHGSGAATTHTFTQPGTYVVKVATHDGAGNAGTATATIAVAARPTPPTPTPTPTTPTTPPTTPTTPTPTTPTTSLPPGTTGVSPTTVTAGQVSAQAGGGPTQRSDLGRLDVIAPKRFRAGRTSLLLAVTAQRAGRLSVALLKGSSIKAKKAATFGGAGTFSLKLRVPRRLAAGRYRLKLTFTPKGADRAVTRTLKLTVVAARKARQTAKRSGTAANDATHHLRGIPSRGPEPRIIP